MVLSKFSSCQPTALSMLAPNATTRLPRTINHLFVTALILVDGVDLKAGVGRFQLRLQQLHLSEPNIREGHNKHNTRPGKERRQISVYLLNDCIHFLGVGLGWMSLPVLIYTRMGADKHFTVRPLVQRPQLDTFCSRQRVKLQYNRFDSSAKRKRGLYPRSYRWKKNGARKPCPPLPQMPSWRPQHGPAKKKRLVLSKPVYEDPICRYIT